MTHEEYHIPAGWIADGGTSHDELELLVDMFFYELSKAFPVEDEDE